MRLFAILLSVDQSSEVRHLSHKVGVNDAIFFCKEKLDFTTF
jgi:hypothetical protein